MPHENSTPTPSAAEQPSPAASAPVDGLRAAILWRFRRCGVTPAEQALRSAVLAYLTGGKT
jgi:hypothetical protein